MIVCVCVVDVNEKATIGKGEVPLLKPNPRFSPPSNKAPTAHCVITQNAHSNPAHLFFLHLSHLTSQTTIFLHLP